MSMDKRRAEMIVIKAVRIGQLIRFNRPCQLAPTGQSIPYYPVTYITAGDRLLYKGHECSGCIDVLIARLKEFNPELKVEDNRGRDCFGRRVARS